MQAHPLDRPVWNALTTNLRHLARGDARARRIDPDHGLFAAAADPSSSDAITALIAPGETVGTMEATDWPIPSDCRLDRRAMLVQMVAGTPVAPPPAGEAVVLTCADDAAMLALATLTRPGPFFARTARLGRFVGIRREGRLVAMAGERLSLPGFTEVSGVCTHPDWRGHGFAATLLRDVAAAIQARGLTPFLTSYADNHGAIRLYETIGFAIRREMVFATLTRC